VHECASGLSERASERTVEDMTETNDTFPLGGSYVSSSSPRPARGSYVGVRAARPIGTYTSTSIEGRELGGYVRSEFRRPSRRTGSVRTATGSFRTATGTLRTI
jgi:hypothetical protein